MQHALLGPRQAPGLDPAGLAGERLLVGQRQLQAAFGQRRQQLGLLAGGAQLDQQPGAEQRTGQQRLHQQALADHFHDRALRHGIAVQAALLLGQAQRQPAELGIGLPGRRAVTGGLLEHAPALEEVVLLGGIALQAVTQHGDGFNVRSHSPSTALATILRWISDEPPKTVAARL
ncbi:hypothetical protein D3C81_1297450 [compost metagenome]